jgi:hypothetical protein
LTNLIAGRNPWRRATTEDPHFHHYMSNRDALQEMLPISKGAAAVLKRVFTFNPAERISIAELRIAVLAVDTFFLTDGEVATASPALKCAAAAYTPRVPAPVITATPELVGVGMFESMHHYPDDEYLYPSPDPDRWSLPTTDSATALSTPSTLVSATNILYSGDSTDEISAKVAELGLVQVLDDVVADKLSAPPIGHRLLAKLLA